MKSLLKLSARAISTLLVLPFAMGVLLAERVGIDLFPSIACGLSLIPGKTGSYLRVAFYKLTLQETAWSAFIGFGSFFSKRDARVGANSWIGAYCILGSVYVGRNVFIASRVSVPSGRYQHMAELKGEPSQGPRFSRVSIGEGSWVGEGAIVMADVGKNCIVGAGSVVITSVTDGLRVAGNPARAIGRSIS